MNELDRIVTPKPFKRAGNHAAWALCTKQGNGRWHVRRVVWGIIMARAEKREGEKIKRAHIMLRAD